MKEKLNLVNKRGLYSYECIETYQCGIVLTGPEFKAIRNRNISFNDSCYAFFENGELFLTNLNITVSDENINPNRKKKLLLTKKELTKLSQSVNQKGLTLIPSRIYQNKRFIKLELALAKGRNNVNKKNALKERDIKRDTDREMKRY